MKTLCAVFSCSLLVLCAGPSFAEDDNAKKIVAVWEITKAGSGLSVGSTVEFTKDMKLKIVGKINDMEEKLDGTYKIEKDKVMIKLTFMGQDLEETLTIKKLTDDALELEDKDNKVDVLKKKK